MLNGLSATQYACAERRNTPMICRTAFRLSVRYPNWSRRLNVIDREARTAANGPSVRHDNRIGHPKPDNRDWQPSARNSCSPGVGNVRAKTGVDENASQAMLVAPRRTKDDRPKNMQLRCVAKQSSSFNKPPKTRIRVKSRHPQTYDILLT
jgi:hypothetical protein